jgi:hypothetical protein
MVRDKDLCHPSKDFTGIRAWTRIKPPKCKDFIQNTHTHTYIYTYIFLGTTGKNDLKGGCHFIL